MSSFKMSVLQFSSKVFLGFTLLFLLSIHSLSVFAQSQTWYRVSKFVDGDTFWVQDDRGEQLKVRLIGIDTPESRNSGRKTVEYYGKEAAAYVRAFVGNKRLLLEYDVSRTDRYKRTLAYVYLEDGTFLNAHLVREGYARVLTVPPNVKFAESFVRLEREARKNKKGLWGR